MASPMAGVVIPPRIEVEDTLHALLDAKHGRVRDLLDRDWHRGPLVKEEERNDCYSLDGGRGGSRWPNDVGLTSGRVRRQ